MRLVVGATAAGVLVAGLLAVVGCDSGEDGGADKRGAPPVRDASVQGPRVLLAWARPRLETGVGRVAAVDTRVVVRRGRVLLQRSGDARGRVVHTASPGFAYPLEVVAFDPGPYARLLPASARPPFARLGRGRAILSRSSARVRRLGIGGMLELRGGRRLRVVGVVPDGIVRGAEVVVDADEGRRLGVTNPRHALLAYRGDTLRAIRAVRETRNAAGRSRVRDVGRAPWAVGGRVLPPALVKARFGEFAIAVSGAASLAIDPAWVRRWISTASVPILGRVTCHRRMLPALRRALGELERRGLGRIVDAGDYAGCFAPGTIANSGGISQHTWGLAVDLNAGANPYGERSRQDVRLVRTMRRHGFAWGGRWPTPDAMHFEFRGR